MNLLDVLREKSQIKYKDFTQKLVSTKYEILGVKLPDLRLIASKMSDDEKLLFLEENNDYSTIEQHFIYGFLLSDKNLSYNDFLKYFYKFIPFVDNWSLCDSSISSMKIIAKNKDKFLLELNKLFSKKDEFYIRIAFVILLNYYVTDEWLNYIFDKCENVNFDAYYVNMAKAWLLSICYVKYKNETLNYLKNSKLDNFTFNKTISKICDSYRVLAEEKVALKLLKRKNF